MTRARIASHNLGQRINWSTRLPLLLDLYSTSVKASVYMWQECDEGMALDLCKGLGWTDSSGRPCYWTDSNRNTVAVDPGKFWDLRAEETSLSAESGDLGDRHFRSSMAVLVEHELSGARHWFVSAHLSNGDASEDRATQARVLVDQKNFPKGYPVAMGIDRNCWPTSEPALILAEAGLTDLTLGADDRRTYPAGDTRTDRKHIDAVYGLGVLLKEEDGVPVLPVLVDPGKATDHRCWVLTIELEGNLL